MCIRTIRHWDSGRNRVPWSAVRLLRVLRAGELGGLHDSWEGWTINRNGLHAPDGRTFTERSMRLWWLTCEQAFLFRQGYDAATRPSAGDPVPDTVQAADGGSLLLAMPGRRADTLPASSAIPAASPFRQTAFLESASSPKGRGHRGGGADAVPAALGFITNATSVTKRDETCTGKHRAGGAS